MNKFDEKQFAKDLAKTLKKHGVTYLCSDGNSAYIDTAKGRFHITVDFEPCGIGEHVDEVSLRRVGKWEDFKIQGNKKND